MNKNNNISNDKYKLNYLANLTDDYNIDHLILKDKTNNTFNLKNLSYLDGGGPGMMARGLASVYRLPSNIYRQIKPRRTIGVLREIGSLPGRGLKKLANIPTYVRKTLDNADKIDIGINIWESLKPNLDPLLVILMELFLKFQSESELIEIMKNAFKILYKKSKEGRFDITELTIKQYVDNAFRPQNFITGADYTSDKEHPSAFHHIPRGLFKKNHSRSDLISMRKQKRELEKKRELELEKKKKSSGSSPSPSSDEESVTPKLTSVKSQSEGESETRKWTSAGVVGIFKSSKSKRRAEIRNRKSKIKKLLSQSQIQPDKSFLPDTHMITSHWKNDSEQVDEKENKLTWSYFTKNKNKNIERILNSIMKDHLKFLNIEDVIHLFSDFYKKKVFPNIQKLNEVITKNNLIIILMQIIYCNCKFLFEYFKKIKELIKKSILESLLKDFILDSEKATKDFELLYHTYLMHVYGYLSYFFYFITLFPVPEKTEEEKKKLAELREKKTEDEKQKEDKKEKEEKEKKAPKDKNITREERKGIKENKELFKDYDEIKAADMAKRKAKTEEEEEQHPTDETSAPDELEVKRKKHNDAVKLMKVIPPIKKDFLPLGRTTPTSERNRFKRESRKERKKEMEKDMEKEKQPSPHTLKKPPRIPSTEIDEDGDYLNIKNLIRDLKKQIYNEALKSVKRLDEIKNVTPVEWRTTLVGYKVEKYYHYDRSIEYTGINETFVIDRKYICKIPDIILEEFKYD
jgi:hypothetical protein